MLEPIRTQNLGSLLMKLSQSNLNLWSPDCYLVCSYLIATVTCVKAEESKSKYDFRKYLNSLCFVMGSYGRIKSFTAETSIGFEPSQSTKLCSTWFWI